ncbi:hypothetical protein C8R30_10540 [Nitrosomonas nitrosa]|uniref:hypothetical protein n=1 Tax=Nitrosomonas nitrosa TaxID=52442 RepID=UPI000D31BD54|nr:hypothetical protein [Nitrosomonas nitrosa]PTR02782.1 hypothetical protein C8R30_10540 [Nitrosomonas nitrosa]
MIGETKFVSVVRRLAPSALIFLSGVGALYVADLTIAASANDEAIALWATLKSFMMIASTFALFGINQLLVREPKAMRLLTRVGGANILVVSLVLGIIGAYFDLVPSILVGIVAIAGFSFSNLAFQWLRSNLQVTAAYLANGSWRVLFLLGILVFFINDNVDIGMILTGSFVISGLIIVGLIVQNPAKKNLVSLHDDIRSVKDIYLIGSSYFLAAISLSIATYGENLVVHQIGTTADVAQYFRASVVFLFPGMILNQYLTAVFGLAVRQEESRVLKNLRRYLWKGLAGLLLMWPVLIAGGYVLEMLVYGEISTSIMLATLLSMASCLRLLYVLPGSFIGVIANRRTLLKASIIYLICAFSLPLLSLLFHSLGMATVISVALASLISWTLRCAVGAGLVYQRLVTVTLENK